MIEEITKNIRIELDRIDKENKELIDEVIYYETSRQLGVGINVLVYGTFYKIIKENNNLEDCLKELSYLYQIEEFDGRESEIDEIIDKLVEGCKEHRDTTYALYTIDILLDLENKIKKIIKENCYV